MHIKVNKNTNLYGMEKYFNEIIKLYDKEIMPNKILLSGKKGIGKSTLAHHIINYILSKKEEYNYDKKNFIINKENKSYKLIEKNSHPNFYLIDLIDEKKNIDIAQIRAMISYTNKSCFNNMPRFILIDNIENLNKNSVNALLKVVEEPNLNIFFILIHNNLKPLLPTLKSRCLDFKINFSFDESVKITNLLIDENFFDLMNQDLINYYNSPGEIINLLNYANEKKINLKNYSLIEIINLIIDSAHYKKNKLIKLLLINFIELYFLKQYKLSKGCNLLSNFYRNFIYKIHNTEKFNLDEESLFLEFKSKLL